MNTVLLASPAICNPAKNTLGTNGGGLTRSDCTPNFNFVETVKEKQTLIVHVYMYVNLRKQEIT